MTTPAVIGITIGDEPGAWRAAGFSVAADGTAVVGTITLTFVGRDGGKGIRGWTWSGLAGSGPLDGLVTESVDTTGARLPGAHPIGVTVIDHVVIVTPDLERTVPAFEARGLEVRRVRHTDQYGPPFRQVFFRGGETIIEMIGPDRADQADDRSAHFYGLAFTVGDLDATVAGLDEHVGSVKDAVQPGRRIATLRHRDFDISVPIALMSA